MALRFTVSDQSYVSERAFRVKLWLGFFLACGILGLSHQFSQTKSSTVRNLSQGSSSSRHSPHSDSASDRVSHQTFKPGVINTSPESTRNDPRQLASTAAQRTYRDDDQPDNRLERSSGRSGNSRLIDSRRTEPGRANRQLDPRWRETIEDHTIGIRKQEAAAYWGMLDEACSSSQRTLLQQGRTDIPYAEMMDHPGKYRGELVSLVGTLRRLSKFQASANDYGFEELYEAWIFTSDSGTHPLRVVCESIPQSMNLATETRIDVKITGYFLKIEGYQAHNGLQLAPVILAKRIDYFRNPTSLAASTDDASYFFGGILGIGLLFGIVLVGWNALDRDLLLQRRQRTSPAADLATRRALAEMHTETISEGLARMERDLETWTPHVWQNVEAETAAPVMKTVERRVVTNTVPVNRRTREVTERVESSIEPAFSTGLHEPWQRPRESFRIIDLPEHGTELPSGPTADPRSSFPHGRTVTEVRRLRELNHREQDAPLIVPPPFPLPPDNTR